MAHIPPDRPITKADVPITIQGGADTITIELPSFYEVKTSMSVTLSGEGGLASICSKAAAGETFKSIITRIVLEDVQKDPDQSGGLVFKPKKDGRCTVKIFFDHPR